MLRRAASVAALLALAGSAWAADKSGVKPSVLSLPSGPGSIEGLGESFEPQLNSGTSSYAVKLQVPPGRAGFAPELTLSYSSGSGNAVLGLGWKLGLPEIQRQTDKGLPSYGDGSVGGAHDTYVYSNGEELVPTADGFLRCENEGEFIRFQRSGAGFLATRRDGVVMSFGVASSRVEDGGRVFRWLLEDMTDPDGNTIAFSWRALDDTRQLYLQEVLYNPGDGTGMAVVLDYEPRPDVIADFRPRFELITAYRLTEVSMWAARARVRSYLLAYAPTSDSQPLSLLESVTQVGSDGASTLPPATFEYTAFDPSAGMALSMPTAPSLDLDTGTVDLLDLNADGLPDLLDTTEFLTLPHAYYLNLGPDESGVVRWASVARMGSLLNKTLSSPDVQLADMDGDGRTDLLDKFSENNTQYFRIGPDLSWQWVAFISQAGFTFADLNTRMVDLDNDKRIDVLRTDGDVYSAWLALPDGSWSGVLMAAAPNPAMRFEYAYVRLADMNGDRLQDLVRLQDAVCVYYPAKGLGEYGPAVTMQDPPSGVIDESRLLTADVNGDGLSDVVLVRGGAVDVYLNLGIDPADHSRGRFAAPYTVTGPYTDGGTCFRQADVNGNGSTDILWNTVGAGAQTFAFVDFTPGEQPYQLKTITNGIGRTTVVSYRSSVVDYVRDRDAGRPWPQGIPFPVPVVARIEVSDGREGVVYTTEFAYHDGYYDGVEKEFRGFAAAERTEVGDEAQGAPSLVTAYAFDTGATVEALKGKPLAVERRTEEGEVFDRDLNTWTARTLIPGLAGDDRNVVLAFQSATTREVLERGRGTPVVLYWEYDVDDWGNQALEAAYGRVEDLDGSGTVGDSAEDLAAWGDERVTISTWSASYPSGEATWILDRLVEQEVRDGAGSVLARTRNYYDDEGFSGANLGSVVKGHLTMTRRWHDPSASDGFVTSARSRYDEWGNATRIYDPLWNGATSGHFREIAYDSTFHTFPTAETIHTANPDTAAPVTLTISAAYDPRFGVVTSSVDFNGFETLYGYDAFGRLTSIIKPGDTPLAPTLEYDYVLAHHLGGGAFISWVETRQRESAGGGTVDSRTFYDGLGRKVMTRAEGEDPGQVVVTDTVRFNARRSPWKKYIPYFEGGSLDFVEPTFNTGYTEHHYDAVGRETQVIQPVAPGLSSRVFSRTTYQPLVRLVQDEEQTNPASPHSGCAMRYTSDGLLDEDGNGRLRQVDEIVKLNDDGTPSGSLHTWSTTYSYDALGNLQGYVDSQGNRKHILYDGLSRKTFMDDPDRSWMWYAYDAAGNLLRTRDAKGQEIAYAYDGVNRLQSEHYCTETEETGAGLAYGQRWTSPGAAPARRADVAYHYDTPVGPVETGMVSTPTAPELVVEEILGADAPDPAMDLNRDATVDVGDVAAAVDHGNRTPESVIPREVVTARNTRGYLAWVRDTSGEEHTSYDERGRVEWVVKRINRSSPEDYATFKTANQYDSMDRVTRLIYPDLSWVDYTYNSRGLLESIPNVVPRADYNPAGQLARLGYACGTVTTYDYDHRLRLQRLATQRLSDGVWLQDLNYTYDGVSNITAITDARTDAHLDAIGSELGLEPVEARKFRETQSFTYDSLYRLTGASSASVWGSVAYRYDRIGNMIRKEAALLDPDPLMDLGEMAYGGSSLGAGNAGAWNRDGRAPSAPPGPHAFTMSQRGGEGGGGLAAEYDANGNMVIRWGLPLEWDHRDRVRRASSSINTSSMSYSYDDTRVRKAELSAATSTEVLYVSPSAELRDGEFVRFVLLDGRRQASSASALPSPQPISADEFILADHAQSNVMALNESSVSQSTRSFFPYGVTRREANRGGSRRVSRYTFLDREADELTHLDYLRARHLSTSIGAFASVDPLLDEVADEELIASPQRLNLYSYARRSPEVLKDPNGLVESFQGSITTKDGYQPTASEQTNAFSIVMSGSLPGMQVGIEAGWYQSRRLGAITDSGRFMSPSASLSPSGVVDPKSLSLFAGICVLTSFVGDVEDLGEPRGGGIGLLVYASPDKKGNLRGGKICVGLGADVSLGIGAKSWMVKLPDEASMQSVVERAMAERNQFIRTLRPAQQRLLGEITTKLQSSSRTDYLLRNQPSQPEIRSGP